MKQLETLLELFRNLRPLDVLDILLVALLVYQLLMLTRRSRAISLVKGVLLVLAMVLVTTWFPTFNWLLSRLILPGTIALVVIFQPELRMALERLGRDGGPYGRATPALRAHRTARATQAQARPSLETKPKGRLPLPTTIGHF